MSKLPSILLIEDNEADRVLIRSMLTSQAQHNWEVASATTLAEGLSLLSASEPTTQFAAVLLDLSLPDSHGLETFSTTRKAASQLPIVVLTGNSDRAVSLEAVKCGAQDYLLKNDLSESLLEKSLRYAIERKRLEVSWRTELEHRVDERTAELSKANCELESEIAERRATEAALEESHRFVESIMNATPSIVFILDLVSQRIRYVNEQLESLLGLTLEDVSRCDSAFLERSVHPDDLARVTSNLQAASQIQNGESCEFEHRIRAADGSWRWMATRLVPFRRATDGSIRLVLGASNDVTDRKRAEEEARLKQEQLVFVNRQSLLGEFAAGLAHELNQPLMAALNYAQASLRRVRNEDWSRDEVANSLEKITQQTMLSGEIIKRLRRMVAKQPPKQVDTDVSDMIHETLQLARTDADRCDVRVNCEIDGSLPAVKADRIQIQQVLLNLIRNSLDAMHSTEPSNRVLSVEAARADTDRVEIRVTDRGEGCDAKYLDRMFEPFFTTKPRGLGMGLPISRSIIEAHGGRLTAQPNRSEGMTFRFTLPLRTEVLR